MTSSTAKKALVTAVLGVTVLSGAPAASAAVVQDGLVNVNVGNITVRDAVDIGVAAQVAAQICGVKVGPVAVLGVAVDRSGASRTVCTSEQGPVTLTQN